MLSEKFQYIFNKKGLRLLVLALYALMILVFYSSSVLSAKNNALQWVKSDMQKNIDTFLLSIDAEFNKRTWYAASLVGNNSLRIPLSLGIYTQVWEFLNEDEGISKGDYKIMVVDAENKEVFNNTGHSGNLSGLETADSPYSGYIYDGGILRLNYIPAFSEYISKSVVRKRVGAVISAYDFLDFSSLVPKSEKGINYTYYGFVSDKLLFIINGKPKAVDRQISQDTLNKFKEGIITLNVDGRDTLMYMKNIPLLKSEKPFILSVSIPPSQYRLIENGYLYDGLKYSTLAALLITAIMVFIYYMLQKDFTNKLEIQSLRTQRHDFSKHIDVIRGMAALDEFDELKSYVETLGERISFAGELSNLGCPPLSVLIEEKEVIAGEKGIIFSVDVRAAIRGIGIKPYDLCTVMGNIIDNAIEACIGVDGAPPRVHIETGTIPGYFYFKVSNIGKPIPENDIEKIFRSGYSTKTKKGNRGMGLYIVSRTLRKYNGSIEVDCFNDLTTFKVFIPDKKTHP